MKREEEIYLCNLIKDLLMLPVSFDDDEAVKKHMDAVEKLRHWRRMKLGFKPKERKTEVRM
jgi:hypothetical protein